MSQTQCASILHYLRCGRHLTPMAALELFGCWRLAGRVAELRKQGHQIKTKIVMGENGKHYAEYRID